MSEPCCCKVQAVLAIWECPDHAGAAADFLHPLQWVIGPDLQPMTIREAVVAERLVYMGLNQLGRLAQLLAAQVFDDLCAFSCAASWLS